MCVGRKIVECIGILEFGCFEGECVGFVENEVVDVSEVGLEI